MKSQIKADLMLLLVKMIWGTYYLLTDFTLEELDPFNINALRLSSHFFQSTFGGKWLRPVKCSDIKNMPHYWVPYSWWYIWDPPSA